MKIHCYVKLQMLKVKFEPPTPSPTDSPMHAPTEDSKPAPTSDPTPGPTANPTPAPTADPTPAPTNYPTPSPTHEYCDIPFGLEVLIMVSNACYLSNGECIAQNEFLADIIEKTYNPDNGQVADRYFLKILNF